MSLPVNNQDIFAGVKPRIMDTFVSLIPEDKWDQMIKEEVENFFKKKPTGYNQSSTSDFSVLVNNIVKDECASRLKHYLASADFITMWDTNGQPVASEFVKNMVVENSGVILSNFYASIASMMLQQFRTQLNQSHY